MNNKVAILGGVSLGFFFLAMVTHSLLLFGIFVACFVASLVVES